MTTLARDGISPRHLARLNAVADLDTAPFNFDTDQYLVDAGLLDVLPNGDVQLASTWTLTQVTEVASLCICTDGGRQLPVSSCLDCRGEGMVQR